ncbi:MAG: SoxR reducing system RseC family protein [Pseudomonas sp.]
MIEERGRVLSVEQGAVWVETIRRSACDSCQARNGCGQSVLQRLGLGARQGFVRVLDEQAGRSRQVGDDVIIGIPENAVLQGSAVVYLIPLGMLFAGALLAQGLGATEPWIILAGLFGMGIGFAAVRWHGLRSRNNPAFMPRVLGRAAGTVGVVNDIRERSEY